ncbi:MAG: helix-turn-helix transcriptional regulator [Lachnospiraceae bacterium]|nr:helix-turn-helix transcriptional regulator [Lachnospiraceae bacterium]
MGRVSVKENKNLYQIKREELGLSREKASELLESIPPERIEKIENQKSLPHPEEVLVMAEAYKTPNLCNYYCANDCPIGKQYVPEIEMKDLSQIVLEMLASLNAMRGKQERLIEITVDGIVDGEEIKDFVHIQEELEKISITVETLQLWVEQMIAENKIDVEAYQAYKSNLKK